MGEDQPATKADLGQLKPEMKDFRIELKQSIDQLRFETTRHYNDLAKRISEAETRILKAVSEVASASNRRMDQIEANNAEIKSRLTNMEDRILKLERRANLPPAA